MGRLDTPLQNNRKYIDCMVDEINRGWHKRRKITFSRDAMRLAEKIGVKPTRKFLKRVKPASHKNDPQFLFWKAGRVYRRLLKYANKKVFDTTFVSKMDIRQFHMRGIRLLPPDQLPPQKHYILETNGN